MLIENRKIYLIWFCWQRRKPLAYQVYPFLPSCRSIQEVHYLQVCLFLQEFQEDRILGFLWDRRVQRLRGFQGFHLFHQPLCLPKIRSPKKLYFQLSTVHLEYYSHYSYNFIMFRAGIISLKFQHHYLLK